MAKMTAEEIITKRIELKKNIDHALIERLNNYNTLITDVSLIDMAFTEEFSNAVEAKQIAEQKSQQAHYEAEMEKQRAEATINKARGEAEAQRLLQKNLTPKLLELKAINKWDGHLPLIMGSKMNGFIDINKLNTMSYKR